MDRTQNEFLSGGGEMGARMRALDWRATPLGDPAGWPQSLKTIVRVMLDSRFAMWMAWGSESTFFCNDAYLPTVGDKREWVLGARADRVWEEIWHDIGPRIAQVLDSGRATWDFGLQLFLRRSGYAEETFHTFSYSPVYDDHDHVAGMLCVVAEDTERIIGERRLRLLNELSSLSTADAGSIEAAGRRMLEVLASDREDLPFAALYLVRGEGEPAQQVGATPAACARILPAAAHAGAGSPLERAIGSGTEQRIDTLAPGCEIAGPWGEPVQQALAIPLRGTERARPSGCLLLGISNRRRLDDAYRSFLRLVADQFAAQLRDTEARLQAEQRVNALAELDRAKNLFFSNVSHELRTPLTLMLGPAEDLLARAALPPGMREDLELMRRNGLRLRRLVNSLLDFSRIEAGRIQASLRPTDIAALTQDLASVFRSAIEGAGLRFTVRCEPVAGPVCVDPEMWEKIVLNLLSNAFKFTFEGEIELSMRVEDGRIVLAVRDTGVGIPKEHLERVFDRFHRVEGARARSQEGSGIGLALVRELVKLHGGEIAVESAAGAGTLFRLWMPVVRDCAPAADVAPGASSDAGLRQSYLDEALRGEHSSLAAHPAEAPTGAGRAPERILLADDNADMRAYLERALSQRWHVETARDGQQALEALARAPFDLLVTDVMMPKLDGRALIRAVRAEPRTHDLPIIVLSAQAGEEARVAGLAMGADDYLVKPFSMPELLARVEVLLMRARMKRADGERDRQLADIFLNAPVGVAILRGPAHVYEFINPVYQQFVDNRVLVGKPIREALPELEGQGIYELLDRVLASGEPHHGHAVPLMIADAKTGELAQRFFEFVYQPMRGEDGAVSGVAVIVADLTESISARHEAESANRAKDEFIAMLGHELRNPLAPIATALQLMRVRKSEAHLKERGIIERQVRHMARLVDDLLDISRISRGTLELRKTRIEIAEVVERAIETSAPLLETRRHFLTVEVPASGLAVLADPTRLSQVVSNLLTNAAKFTPEGGRIAVEARAEGEDGLLLRVCDSGIGMSPAALATCFEQFVQCEQGGLDRPQGGLGLGLAIAQNVVRLHGGSLTAESEGAGRGSVFTIRLSRAAPQEPEASAEASHEPAVAAPARRILVVDDNRDAAHSLREILEQFGHSVLLAEDGPGALRLLEEGTPVDVALLDIGLPVMNGYELARHIRESRNGGAVRLIAVTGYGQASDIARGRDSGFETHLIKPIEIERLIAAIAKAPQNP